jgi:hypothetical protein
MHQPGVYLLLRGLKKVHRYTTECGISELSVYPSLTRFPDFYTKKFTNFTTRSASFAMGPFSLTSFGLDFSFLHGLFAAHNQRIFMPALIDCYY